VVVGSGISVIRINKQDSETEKSLVVAVAALLMEVVVFAILVILFFASYLESLSILPVHQGKSASLKIS
jgi:hypothetical protein